MTETQQAGSITVMKHVRFENGLDNIYEAKTNTCHKVCSKLCHHCIEIIVLFVLRTRCYHAGLQYLGKKIRVIARKTMTNGLIRTTSWNNIIMMGAWVSL